ncbi:stereocilin isoform X3 [Stegostoma tigrinum]|uniref:stereocilin isoform X3 n=1 Tax=Stegostoma tigrinum TaxID=3053191 RepID=UPI00202B6F7D|nr:stereocilin isoform X3 [Stegostoma tigrinum]
MMKAVSLTLLILTVSSGTGEPHNSETKWQSLNPLFGKLNNTKMSTKEVKEETKKKISNNSSQLSPDVTHPSYHNLRRSLQSPLDSPLHARVSSGDSAVLEAIRLAMSSATQTNKREFYYIIWKALFSSQIGATSSELRYQLPQLLFYLFQATKDSEPFFAYVEKLMPSGVNWKVVLRSIQGDACYITSIMSRRSFSDYIGLLLAASVKSSRSTMGTDPFSIQNILLSFVKRVRQAFSNELKPIWYFFGQSVFPLFESYIGHITKQILLTLINFVLEQMLLSNNIIKLDVKGQCSQGNLNQLLTWGLLHNLTWNFEAVTIDDMQILLRQSPAELYRTTRVFKVISDFSQLPTSCNQEFFLSLNRTFCNKNFQHQFDLPMFCSIIGGLAGNKSGPLVSEVCNKMNFIYTYLTKGLNFYTDYCEKRRVDVGFFPSSDTRQIEDMLCNYDSWVVRDLFNSTDFGYCAVMDEVGFRKAICTNSSLLESIMKNPAHFWLKDYCDSNSNTMLVPTLITDVVSEGVYIDFTISPATIVPPVKGVDIYCRYEEWTDFSMVDNKVITFCASHDGDHFTHVICTDQSALKELIKGNFWLADFCNNYSILSGNSEFCMYDKWKEDPIDPLIISLCWRSDQTNFNKSVCNDVILLNKLMLDPSNTWLLSACNAENSCNYEEWLDPLSVTSAVVALCKETDQAAFNRMVCTNPSLLEILLNNSENSWLNDFCPSNPHSTAAPTVVPEEGSNIVPLSSTANPTMQENLMTAVESLCRYENWMYPAVVDSTVVAVCFNIDREQFNIHVCKNPVILQELLKNEFNLWLSDVCSDSSISASGDTYVVTYCQYSQWAHEPIDPYLVDFCWRNDVANFTRFVCRSEILLSELLLYPENAWLKSHCSIQINPHTNDQNENCRYEEWMDLSSFDLAAVEFCSQYDLDNFVQAACDNSTRLWGLLINVSSTWLSSYCSYVEADEINPAATCVYSSWTEQRVDPTTVALCFDYDQSNFKKYVCQDPDVLHALTSDPENTWVEADCMEINNSTNSTAIKICPVEDLISQLQWTCTLGSSQLCTSEQLRLGDIPPLLICGLENVGLMLHNTLIEDLTVSLMDAINKIIMVLMILEDDQIVFLQVVQNAKRSVLQTVLNYLQNEKDYRIKKELLQCFGSVLLNLVKEEGGLSGMDLIRGYLQLSAVDLQGVLFALDIQATEQLLQHLNTNWNGLQIQDDLKRVMASVYFNRILLVNPNIFLEFDNFLPLLSASEIQALPAIMDKEQVLYMVNQSFGKLSSDQRRAFIQWAVNSEQYSNISTWSLKFLHQIGSLLVYLPFEKFQLLTHLQILNSLNVLLMNNLTTVQERFVIRSILKEGIAMTASEFDSLGRLICSATTWDLRFYKQNLHVFDIIKKQLLKCIGNQIFVPNELLTEFLVRTTSVTNQEILMNDELLSMAGLLPILGVSFIKQLQPSQIQAMLPELSAMTFSPVQAREITDKILQNVSITEELLSNLGSLVIGLSPSIMQVIPTALLVHAMPSIAEYGWKLNPVQKLIIVNKLWDSGNIKWIKDLESLIRDIPLISLRSKLSTLLSNINDTRQMKWSVQQAQLLFRKVLEANGHNMTEELFTSLGFVARGVDCLTLKRLITPSAFLTLLQFFRDLPVEMPVPLRNCILEAMNGFVFSMETMRSMQPQLLFDLQLLKIRRFSNTMTQRLLQIMVENPVHFLKIPSSKQSLIVDWIVQVLDLHNRRFSKAEFDLLGHALAFVSDEIFMAISRAEMKANLLKIKDYCFDRGKKFLLGDTLTKDTMFGVTTNWTSLTLDKVDRLVFFLSVDDLQKIPQDALIMERIEMLFHSQKQWEQGDFGSTCLQKMENSELDHLFRKQQILLQTSAGLLSARRLQTKNDLVLSCNAVRNTLPSAWPIDLLTGMSDDDFISCLELFGQDPHFQSFELFQLLERAKQIYRPVSAMPPKVIEQLGRVATQFTEKDLMRLDLSDLGAAMALGKIAEWNRKKLTILFTSFLRVNRRRINELDSVSLVALGHLICGIKQVDISAIDPTQFSMAVLGIGRLSLSCDEQQLAALAKLVSHSQTFGEVSRWRSEEFTEIGSIAAGLPDIILSALVKEQIEGLTPVAIATVPPKKFSVVFSPAQIRMFNYQQAVAVTPSQMQELGDFQKKALDMVLTSWHKTAIDIRGRAPLAHCQPVI